MTASIIITTRNRKECLRVALRSAIEQTTSPEIIVIDDGSSDGTSDLVRAEFPSVAIHRREESKGLVVRRNEAARLANGEIIFSIDDDAIFSTANIVEQTLREFDSPRIGAVAIPCLEPQKGNALRQAAPDKTRTWFTDRFIGTAHALRRDLFLKLGGYREPLVHQGEEGDYCIRMLEAGYGVRLGTSDPIHHFESPNRDVGRMDYYGTRNAVLFAWQNVPRRAVGVHLLATTCHCLGWTWAPGRFLVRVKGLLAGYRECARVERAPVTTATYLRWRRLAKSGALAGYP